nr:DUF3530 family protein [Marinobacter salexigens]
MLGTAVPVLAQDEAVISPTPNEVRSGVSSGLGEWGLNHRFPDSALWLELEDGARTLALFWPETKTPARGAVIILADEGENAASGLTGTLARELANRKLAVLSLGLEPPSEALQRILERPLVAPEPKPEAEGQSPGVPSSAAIDVLAAEAPSDLETAYRKRILDELAAAAAELKNREYELTALVGIGRGSNHVVAYAAELAAPTALIWGGPKFYPRDAKQLAENVNKASVPRILELSLSDASGQRKADLERAGVQGFSRQNVGADIDFMPRDGKAVASRISAWLKRDDRQ